MTGNVIELKDVWKIYDMDEVKVNALKGLNLKIKNGELLGVLGKSGSGKSTTMNMIGSLDTPTKGHIFLDGIDISTLQESQLAQLRGRKIGFIFQTFNLIPSLTTLQNVMLPMMFQNKPYPERERVAKEILARLDMNHRLDHVPGKLSGGERQRVAIARALVNNPEVILADEPTGNLDSKTGQEVIKILKELNQKDKKTIVIVTHDESLVKICDRVCYLRDGAIIKEFKKGEKIDLDSVR
ncbi:MAG: ABC transporter ATP-binding protein [Candidatus Nanoarchaeia archaeon]|nr:ABC transporter ATP-binding protein [Candidatus Nanoarchaeia archaeon]